jgi:hypothetical protein
VGGDPNMKFKEICDHLSKRGFATRKNWNGFGVIFFGVDNAFYFSRFIDSPLGKNMPPSIPAPRRETPVF